VVSAANRRPRSAQSWLSVVSGSQAMVLLHHIAKIRVLTAT
jgi:hypothetical protein